MNQTGYFLLGVEIRRQDQLGFEQEPVLGRDLDPLARAEPQPLELVRRIRVERADEPAVGGVEPRVARSFECRTSSRRNNCRPGSSWHVWLPSACVSRSIDPSAA